MFGETPVVYFADREISRPRNATGVIAPLNLTGTLALATELQPDVREVFVVGGASEGNQAFTKVAHEQFRAFEAEVRSLYERMARISITPEWAKVLDFQSRLPSAVEQLVNRKLVNLDDSSGGWMG